MIPALIEWLKLPIVLERWMYIGTAVVAVGSAIWALIASERWKALAHDQWNRRAEELEDEDE